MLGFNNLDRFVSIGMLDVMQIFGRAGRPQFDTSGEANIITSHELLPKYLSLMNHQLPIERHVVIPLAVCVMCVS